MTARSTISDRGQTAIPAALRRAAAVGPGTSLLWEAVGPNEWRVHIERTKTAAPDPVAMIGFAKTFRPTKPTAEWMRELREGEV